MIQKIDLNEFCGMKGLGRIDDSAPIDLQEYGYPVSKEKEGISIPVVAIPKRISLSKKIGKTVYDVTADFNLSGKETILQQFKKIILLTEQQTIELS